jgi:hypothetical protein
MSRSKRSPSIPPELVDLVERLRATLVEINDSEQDCMANVVASASHAQRVGPVLPNVSSAAR